MNWVEKIQEAIDYIESEIKEAGLSAEMVSKKVHISNVHFNRAFNVVTGLTVSEYIRNRRLTLAGKQFKRGETSVIDVALDWGYESPESFSKAFKRFHGVNPRDSKSSKLKEFYPFKIEINVIQDKPLVFNLEEKSKLYLNGNSRWVLGDDENAILDLWSSSQQNEYLDKCYELEGFVGVVGIYHKERYTIKALCNTPNGEDHIELPNLKWAIFPCDGEMPQGINYTWNRIYSEWMIENRFEASEFPQLEVYRETEKGYSCEIWIAVEAYVI